MPSTRSSRKRQARLAFTPLPSSSPAAKEYNQQIQDRAAALTLAESPSKRRKTKHTATETKAEIINLDGDCNGNPGSIPTPERSVEGREMANEETEDSDDRPVRSMPRRLKQSRTRQQRIDFSNARQTDSFDPVIKLHSSSTFPPSSGNTRMFGSQLQPQLVDDDDSSDHSNAFDRPPTASEVIDHARSSRYVPRPGDEEKLKRPQIRHARRPWLAARGEERHHYKSVVQNNFQQQAQTDNVNEDDDDDMPVGTQRRRERRAGKTSSPAIAESEDDDDMPTTAGTQPRRGRQRRTSHSSFISDSPPLAIESDDDDDLVIVNKPTVKRHKRGVDSEEDDISKDGSSENEDVQVRSSRTSQKQRSLSELERQELADDVNDLASSSAGESPQRAPQSSQSLQKNARQKALDKLKRIRSSQPSQIEGDEHADRDVRDIDEQEDSEDDDEVVPELASRRHMFREDAEDADFIEDDEDDDVLGVPEDMPIEYTRYASMKPKELFKHVVEWMVSKKINPAFRSDDAIYRLAFDKLDLEVRGLAGSKFTSSAWTPEFTTALQARPDYSFDHIDRSSAEHCFRDKCDACNRSNHPPTWQIQFKEKPYHRDTLEDVSNGDDEDDASEGDTPDWDAQGREVAPTNMIFYVGKFCFANAETAHKLQHWRWSLYQFTVMYLTKQGYFQPEEKAKRRQWSVKKRQKYANKVVDRMESDGMIKKLWGEFRSTTSEARSAKQGGLYNVDGP